MAQPAAWRPKGGRGLLLLAAVLIGMAIGLGGFTFVYAKGYSYLGKDPAACANCHVMDEHYSAWLKSSHHAVATCNDCHTPHALVPKYATKARNGFWHSFYFTTGNFPDPLRITERNHDIVEHACRDCHAPLVAAMHAGEEEIPDEVRGRSSAEGLECTHCHRYVGHAVR
jgi:cytochrome c nitrite reductase small subunit